MVRPHVTLIAMLALVGAALLRRSPKPSLVSPVAKVLVVVILGVGTVVVLSQMDSFFGVNVLDTQTVSPVLERTTSQSTQGGSEFEATRRSSPVGIAQAAVAVIFRPWPFEAHNVQALFASLEGVLLLGLLLTSLRRIAALPRAMVQRPYVAFAVIYSALFTYAFSAIGNFGILARQRVQLYPLLIIVLCVPVNLSIARGGRPSQRGGSGRRGPEPEASAILERGSRTSIYRSQH
jgi:ascorbate-specific PTS system EIIC-type component UlaA